MHMMNAEERRRVGCRIPQELLDLLNSIADSYRSPLGVTKSLIDHIVATALTEQPWRNESWPDVKARRATDRSGEPTGYVDYPAKLPEPVIQSIEKAINEGAGSSSASFMLMSILWWVGHLHADAKTNAQLLSIQRKYEIPYPFDVSSSSEARVSRWTSKYERPESPEKPRSTQPSEIPLSEILLIGLDAAADLRNFGCALGRMSPKGNGTIDLLDSSVLSDDAGVQSLGAKLEKSPNSLIAIDAPLGWPFPMGNDLMRHQAGQSIPGDANHFFRRLTDRKIKERTGKLPLDVGADRIARAAFKALRILDHLSAVSGKPVRMAWSPADVEPGYLNVVEVYPAATLHVYGLPSSGYKKDDQHEQRKNIVDAVHRKLNGIHRLIDQQADMFDAALCLLAAEDFLVGRALGPDSMELPIAMKEGWIWVSDRNS